MDGPSQVSDSPMPMSDTLRHLSTGIMGVPKLSHQGWSQGYDLSHAHDQEFAFAHIMSLSKVIGAVLLCCFALLGFG